MSAGCGHAGYYRKKKGFHLESSIGGLPARLSGGVGSQSGLYFVI
jgi:hypothetical protein